MFTAIMVGLTVFFGGLTVMAIVKKVEAQHISTMGAFFLFCAFISYILLHASLFRSAEENAVVNASQAARKTCEAKWGANDTQRNTALMIVQMQFARIDQASLAPTNPYSAISILCDIEANKAKEVAKLSSK